MLRQCAPHVVQPNWHLHYQFCPLLSRFEYINLRTRPGMSSSSPSCPHNCPFTCGDVNPCLINGSLGPRQLTSQTASRSFQSFCTAHGRESLYFTSESPFSLKTAPWHASYWITSNKSSLPTEVYAPNCISIGLAVFAGLRIVIDRPRYLRL